MVAAFASAPTGLICCLDVALAACSALSRCRRAMWVMHRYRLTTWRWGRAISVLLTIGVVLKMTSSF